MHNVILIGFMGSGKSSIGKLLAEKTQMNFLDTDIVIEKEQGRSIPDIFAESGETYFRNLETKLLQRLVLETDNTVIAIGGGMPLREENQILLHKLGILIYLEAAKETIIERLYKDRSRPLLQGGSLEDRIVHLMSLRKHIYEDTSDSIIITDHKSPEWICSEIKKVISGEECI